MPDKVKEKVKGILEKAKTSLKKIPKIAYIALTVLLVGAVVLAAVLNQKDYGVLFTNLGSSEMQSILGYLNENGITDYQVENGDTILVPEKQEAAMKAQLLLEGYPETGFAYSYSEKSGPFSTESERAAAELRDLQDRLSAVVRCFDDVKDAVVSITPAEDHRYVLDSQHILGAKASVLVTMVDNRPLSKQSVEAIRNLVAHSVKGLAIESVEISDTAGNSYGMADGLTDGEASALKLQLEEQWENKIRGNVLQVLIPYFGEENVRVGVSCTVDVNRTEENDLQFHLPDWADDGSTGGKGIIGSQIYDNSVILDRDEPAGGVVGTETNADIPEYVEDETEPGGGDKESHQSGQIDYDNSKTETHVIRTAGYLTDCTISVSINATTAGEIDARELQQHVARVAGIRGTVDPATGEENFSQRISVISMPFYEETSPIIPIAPQAPVKMWVVYAVLGGVLLLAVIITVVIVIVKKKKAKKIAKQKRELERLKAQQGAAGAAMTAAPAEQPGQNVPADVMDLQMEKSIELRQDLRKFAEENPEIAAQMIKNWMKGDEE